MHYTIEEFCDKHRACSKGRVWAIANCSSMQEAWTKLPDDWLLWVAFCRDVLTDAELNAFSRSCEKRIPAWAKAKARARAGAEAGAMAWNIGLAMAESEAWAMAEVRASACAMAEATAYAWAMFEQARWLRENTRPNFEKV